MSLWSEEPDALVWHSGATSFLGFLPDRGAAIFVLSHTAEPVDGLAREFLDWIVRRAASSRRA